MKEKSENVRLESNGTVWNDSEKKKARAQICRSIVHYPWSLVEKKMRHHIDDNPTIVENNQSKNEKYRINFTAKGGGIFCDDFCDNFCDDQ